MSCNILTRCLISNPCPQPGGISPDVRIGFVRDIDTSTLTFGPNGDVTGFSLLTGKFLRRFESRRFKNSYEVEDVSGENGIVFFNHKLNLTHYINSQADIAALEELRNALDVFAIVLKNDGKHVVLGLDRSSPQSFGLKATAGGYLSGVNLGDDNSDKVTLSGEITNKEMFFFESQTTAANLALLNSLTACP